MPLPRWLLSLIPQKSAQSGTPPPPRGEGWGGGQAPAIQPPPTSDPSAQPDHSHRIHIAANDPAFPAKRDAAITLICQAITDIAAPMGYTRKGTTWSRTTARGKSAIHLQRSRYGFAADINLRFLMPDGTAPDHGIWAQDDDVSLRHFYLSAESSGPENGVIIYLDVHDDPASLDLIMHILATRALPWLDAHHSAPFDPDIDTYLLR